MTIHAFISEPAQSIALAKRGGAGLIVACPDAPEFLTFRQAAPDGFAARIYRGETPDGLEPVPLGPGAQLRAWRIKD